VLQLRAGLTAGDLAAIADLERRTLAADGGRLKLEWGELNRRDGGQIEDLLWWEARRPGQERLIGFLGLYAFGAGVELAGMVDPAARRSGMATRLLHAARPLLQARACAQALLVCPRATTSGALFSAAQQAPLDHSEYALILAGDPSDGPTDSATSIADACRDDEPAVRRLLESAFGHPAADGPAMSRSDSAQHLVVRRDGAVIGYLRLSLSNAALAASTVSFSIRACEVAESGVTCWLERAGCYATGERRPSVSRLPSTTTLLLAFTPRPASYRSRRRTTSGCHPSRLQLASHPLSNPASTPRRTPSSDLPSCSRRGIRAGRELRRSFRR